MNVKNTSRHCFTYIITVKSKSKESDMKVSCGHNTFSARMKNTTCNNKFNIAEVTVDIHLICKNLECKKAPVEIWKSNNQLLHTNEK